MLKAMSASMFLLALLCAATVQSQTLPKVDVVYQAPDGSIFDRGCARLTKGEIRPEWVVEVVRRRDEFQSAWDKDGAEFLRAALDEIGLPFPYAAVQAHLTVCSPVNSMSDPLLINVRRYLSDAAEPSTLWGFAFSLYHELMHTYVRPVLSVSDLRRKYAGESPNVQNHLHVMALEKLVLLKLGKQEELKRWDNTNRTNAFAVNNGYKRAWEIMNDVEGYEAFVRELKGLTKTQTRGVRD